MATRRLQTQKVIELLNHILEHELAGVVRYTDYALMTFGYARIPIAGFFNGNADESLQHARLAGEHITSLGGVPSMKTTRVTPLKNYTVDNMLRAALKHEQEAVEAYTSLVKLVEGRNIELEEYARSQVAVEAHDVHEIEKMMRMPGDTGK